MSENVVTRGQKRIHDFIATEENGENESNGTDKLFHTITLYD